MVIFMVFLRKKSSNPADNKKAFHTSGIIISGILAILLGISIYAGFILSSEKIYSGVFIDGIDMGGLTREEALVLLRKNMGNIIVRDGINLSTPSAQYRLPLQDIGYEPEYGKALDKAYSIGREGNILRRIVEIIKLRRQIIQIRAGICYNAEKIGKILESIRKDIEKKPVNAQIRVENGKVRITPHSTGMKMDPELSLGRIDKSLSGRTLDDVELCVAEIYPEITTQMVEQVTYKLGEYTTSFNTANEGRVHNIKTACGKITQKLILPGEEFSMDAALGDRTEKNGYRTAKVIIGNELVDGLGGGICQVTSTMYNSVLLSGLQVLERRNHTLPLSYIDVGRDATISQGYIDFRFRNDNGYAILIEAKTVGNVVRVTIWGRRPEKMVKTRIRTKVIEKLEPEGMEVITDGSLKPGEVVVLREAKPGYRVEVYRDTIDESGKVIKTEKISVDRYLPQKKKVKISPVSIGNELQETPNNAMNGVTID